MVNNSRQLSISDPITVDDDTIRKLFVDLVVLAESITHPDFQVVRKLLSCGLEHHLAVVPVEREGRGGERREQGREGGERRGKEGSKGERRGEKRREQGRGEEERGGEGRGRERKGEGRERRGEERREGSKGRGKGHCVSPNTVHHKCLICAHTHTSYLVMVGLVLAINPPTERPRCDESW